MKAIHVMTTDEFIADATWEAKEATKGISQEELQKLSIVFREVADAPDGNRTKLTGRALNIYRATQILEVYGQTDQAYRSLIALLRYLRYRLETLLQDEIPIKEVQNQLYLDIASQWTWHEVQLVWEEICRQAVLTEEVLTESNLIDIEHHQFWRKNWDIISGIFFDLVIRGAALTGAAYLLQEGKNGHNDARGKTLAELSQIVPNQIKERLTLEGIIKQQFKVNMEETTSAVKKAAASGASEGARKTIPKVINRGMYLFTQSQTKGENQFDRHHKKKGSGSPKKHDLNDNQTRAVVDYHRGHPQSKVPACVAFILNHPPKGVKKPFGWKERKQLENKVRLVEKGDLKLQPPEA